MVSRNKFPYITTVNIRPRSIPAFLVQLRVQMKLYYFTVKLSQLYHILKCMIYLFSRGDFPNIIFLKSIIAADSFPRGNGSACNLIKNASIFIGHNLTLDEPATSLWLIHTPLTKAQFSLDTQKALNAISQRVILKIVQCS